MIIKTTLMPSSASSFSLTTNSLSSSNLKSNNVLNQSHGDEIYGFTSAIEGSRANFFRQSKRELKTTPSKNKLTNSIDESKNDDSLKICHSLAFAFEDSSHSISNSKATNQLNEERRFFHLNQEEVGSQGKCIKKDGKLTYSNQAHESEKKSGWRLMYRHSHNLENSNLSYNQSSIESNIDKLTSDADNIDCIYENMHDIVSINSRISSTAQSHSNRKLTKDSGYESAASTVNWSSLCNIKSNGFPVHSRSDSTESSISTNDGFNSAKVVTTASSKSLYPRYNEKWNLKSASNLPIQIENTQKNKDYTKRSSLSLSVNSTNSNKLTLPPKAFSSCLNQNTNSSDSKLEHVKDQVDSNKLQPHINNTPLNKLELTAKSKSFSIIENSIIENSNRIENERKHQSQNLSEQLKLFSPAQLNSFFRKNYSETKNDSSPPTPPIRDSSLRASLMSTSRTISQTVHSAMTKTSSIFKSNNSNSNNRGSWPNSSFQRKQIKSNSSNASILLTKSPLLALNEKKSKSYSFSKLNNYRKNEQVNKKLGPNCEQKTINEINREFSNLENWPLTQSVNSKAEFKTCSSSLSSLTISDYYPVSFENNTDSFLSQLVPPVPPRNTKKTDRSFSLKNSSSTSGIARSAKVKQPKRQDSASVLYYDSSKSSSSSVSTSSLTPSPNKISSLTSSSSPPPPPLPPKNRLFPFQKNNKDIENLNKENLKNSPKINFNSNRDSNSKLITSNLKAIQKQAVLEFVLKCKREEKAKLNETNKIKNETKETPLKPFHFDSRLNDKRQGIKKIPPSKSNSTSNENVAIHENLNSKLNSKSINTTNESSSSSSPPSSPLPPPPSNTNETEITTDLPLPPPPSLNSTFSSTLNLPNSNSPHSCLCPNKSDTYLASQNVKFKDEERLKNESNSLINNVFNSSLNPTQKPVRLETVTQTGTQVSSFQLLENPKTMTKISINSNLDEMEKDLEIFQNNSNHTKFLKGSILENNNNFKSSKLSTPPKLWPQKICSKLKANESIDQPFCSTVSSSSSQSSSFLSSSNISLESLENGQSLDGKESVSKKIDKIEKLNKKLENLKIKDESLRKEQEANEKKGNLLMKKFSSFGMSNEESGKITTHLDEVERVTRLILSLKGRSNAIEQDIKEKESKIDNSSVTFDSQYQPCPEMKVLLNKRCKLLDQMKEAVQLRESIEKRSKVILESILAKYFTHSMDLNQFEEFVKSKSDLIVQRREVNYKIENVQKCLEILNKS